MRTHTLIVMLGLAATPVFADSTPAGYIVSAPSDSGVFLTLTPAAAQELRQGMDGAPLKVQLVAEPQNAVGNVLSAYRLEVVKVATGEAVPQFAFSSPVTLQLGYWTLFSRFAGGGSWTVVQEAKDVLGAYWYNGERFVRLHELVSNPDHSVTLTVHSAGHYEVRAALPAESFHISPGSPYPRVITPNAAHNRRAFFFFENPGNADVTGEIFDFQGAKVRDLKVDALSPSANCLVWDGRDNNGQVVPTGPYLYKINAGQDSASGGLAVGR